MGIADRLKRQEEEKQNSKLYQLIQKDDEARNARWGKQAKQEERAAERAAQQTARARGIWDEESKRGTNPLTRATLGNLSGLDDMKSTLRLDLAAKNVKKNAGTIDSIYGEGAANDIAKGLYGTGVRNQLAGIDNRRQREYRNYLEALKKAPTADGAEYRRKQYDKNKARLAEINDIYQKTEDAGEAKYKLQGLEIVRTDNPGLWDEKKKLEKEIDEYDNVYRTQDEAALATFDKYEYMKYPVGSPEYNDAKARSAALDAYDKSEPTDTAFDKFVDYTYGERNSEKKETVPGYLKKDIARTEANLQKREELDAAAGMPKKEKQQTSAGEDRGSFSAIFDSAFMKPEEFDAKYSPRFSTDDRVKYRGGAWDIRAASAGRGKTDGEAGLLDIINGRTDLTASENPIGDIVEAGKRSIEKITPAASIFLTDWIELTPQEITYVQDLERTKGEDAAIEWLGKMGPTLGARAYATAQETYNDYLGRLSGPERFVTEAVSSLGSVIIKPVGDIAAGASWVKGLLTGEYNPYSGLDKMQTGIDIVRSKAVEDLNRAFDAKGDEFMSPGNTYQFFLSGLDSLWGYMALGEAYTAAMGVGAATEKSRQLYSEGTSGWKNFAAGAAAGLIEWATEKFSFEVFASNFLKSRPAGILDFAKRFGIQGGVEGTEEFFGNKANQIADELIMGADSKEKARIDEYIKQGMTERDAALQVLWDDVVEDIETMIGSYISIAPMAAGGMAGAIQYEGGALADTLAAGREINETNKGRALSKQALDIAASGNVDAKTAKALEKAAEAYDKKNDVKRAGKLFRAVTDAVNEGITDAEAQETAAGKVASVLLGDGVDYVKASDPETGEAVTVDRAAPIASVEDGNVYMNTDRGEVALEDLAFEDDAVRDMIYSVSEYGPEYANMILTNYGGEDVGTYLGGMREGILTGQYGDLGEELYDFNSLSRADQNLALKIGQSIRADRVAAKAEATKAARLSELNVRGRDLTKQDMKIEGVKAGRGASGRVGQLYFDQGVKIESDLDRANADFAKLVSLVYGNDIVIFDSLQNPELKNKNGMHVGSDGSIWVDIRAGEARQGLVAYALSHEMTHEAAQWAPETYRAFTDFLVKNYAEQGVSVRQLVTKKMADMGTDNFDAAFDEVIADACERFLLDSNAIEKLNEMRKTDRTTFEKIRDFIKSAIAKLKAALQSLKTAGRFEGTEASEAFRNSATGEQIEELDKKIKQLENAWSLVLMEAAQNRAKANGNSEFGIRNSESETDVKYSERLTKDDYARYMELAKDPEKNEAELSQMVEAAAKAAGYTEHAYHGTSEQFTVFSRKAIGKNAGTGWGPGFYFTDRFEGGYEESAREYGGVVVNAYLKLTHPLTFSRKTIGRDEFVRTMHKFESERGRWAQHGFERIYDDSNSDAELFTAFGGRSMSQYLMTNDDVIEAFKSMGFDGLTGKFGNANHTIVFDSSQIKSADPVTYDDQGNVIPLEERFNPENEDIRYSTRAAKSVTETENFKRWFGDSKVVNEDGTPKVVYHGTGSEFYTFEKSNVGSNFGNEEPGYFFTNDYFAANSTAELAALKTGGAERIVEAYLKIENPYVVEAEIDEFGNPEGDPIRYYDKHRSEIRKEAQSGKYDGVIVKGPDGAEMYIVFDSEQIKSADPVTYNDHGRKIRKSRRFDPNNPDFRYSTRTGTSTSTRAVVERALETLKDGPEKTALTAYKRVLDQIDKTIAEYSEARKNRDAAAAAEAKKQLNNLQARARKMETAPAMQNVAALQDVAALNEDVRNLSRLLKLQSTETGGAIAMKSSLEKAVSELMKEHGIRRGKDELAELLNNFYTDMTREVRAETLNREYMVAAAQPVAEWLVDNAPNAKEIDAEAQKVLNEIRGTKISVSEQEREYIENKFGNFEKWRKSLYPIVNVKNDSGSTSFALFWDQLTEKYPDYFDDTIKYDEALLDLEKVISDLKNGRVTEYYLSDEARGWLIEAAANDVAEAFWKIKPYETVADKYAKEIRRLKEDHRAFRNIDEYIQDKKQDIWNLGFVTAKMQNARREYRRKIRTLAENMSTRLVKPQQNKYIPESLQAATAEVLNALDLDSGRSKFFSEKFAQLREQYAKIIEKQKALANNKKNKERYPIATENSVVDDLLKLVTERIDGVAVKDMTTSQLDAVYIALRAFDHEIRNAANAESMNTLLDERMTVPEIGEALIEEVREEHKKRDSKGEVKTDKNGRQIKKDRKNIVARYFDWQIRPEEFFNNLAGYKKNSMWHRVYQMLDNAQRQQIMYEMQGNEIFRDVLADEKYVRSLSARGEKDLLDIGLSDAWGNPFKITRGMMLSIYKHLQNEDNERHVMVGGLVAPNFDAYYSGKIDDVYSEDEEENENRIFGVIGKELVDAYNTLEARLAKLDDQMDVAMIRGDAESMDMIAAEREAAWEEIGKIVEKGREIMDRIRTKIEAKLTDQDRALLAASDKFFSEFSPEILNAATKRMYGFDKARVENYFPIHVSSDFLGADFETIKHDFSVEGMGFMKDRIHSGAPIMLEDIAAVIDRQISNVAKYAALAPALKDFSKVFSVSTGGREYSGSVSAAIKSVFGDRGVKYLENLIADLNGARDREVSILDRLRSRGAGAVLMLNPRVSMVQAASYATAAAEVGGEALVKALFLPEGKNHKYSFIVRKAPRDLIAKYTGMLWTRAQGNIDASVAAVKKIGNTRGLAEKKLRFLSGWIEAVDNATVGRLWYASEYYVQKKNPELKGYKNSPDQAKVDEYYMKVADVFSNVIERTQPNYTVMQRPAVLRSTNAMVKALTMFLTQRLQNASILYSASKRYAKYVSDYNMRTDKKSDVGRNGVTKADVKEAGADLARAVTSQIVSAATISAMRLVADMLLRNMKGRRDEDDEITKESVGWSLLNDFLSSAVSNFVGGSELYEAIRTVLSGGRYYGISAGGLDQINDFVSDTVNVLKNVAKGEFKPKELMAIGTDIGTLFGVPLNNAYKILKMIKGWGEALVNEEAYKRAWFEYGTGEIWETGPMERTKKQKGNLMLKAYREGNKERYREIQRQFNDTAKATARENADAALLDAVYEEWKTGAIDDREALDILEDCLAKPPKTENDERIQIGKWTAKKEGGSQNDYGVYDDLNEALTAYVFPEAGADRVTAGRKAQAMIEQYRAWGYDDKQIRDAIRNTFKSEYVAMAEGKAKNDTRDYIAKLYTFTKDSKGKDYKDKDAKKLIDKWKAAEEAEEEEDEREWG